MPTPPEPPTSRLRVGPPQESAAGLPGVAHATRHALSGMGARRSALTLMHVNRDFDCPGCAWPEPEVPHRAEFCENGVKALAEEATTARLTPAALAARTIGEWRALSDHELGRAGRLTEPVVRRAGSDRYEPIGWGEALALVGERLRALGDPNRALFYTSGRTSNEAAFLYQLLARAYGTNNLPDCSNLCHESSGVALTETIGVGKGTVQLADFEAADLIVVAGQNPGTNHPRMLVTLEAAKRAGARILTVNPLPEAGLLRFRNPKAPRGVLGRGTALSDLHLPIRLGGDQALFQWWAAQSLAAEAAGDADAVDRAYLAAHTEGAAELEESLAGLGWEQVAEATGLDRALVDEATALVVGSKRVIVCWAMGLTQHPHSVGMLRDIVNLLLLKGSVGRPGAGLCPVRGHSNVQGDRTMGIYERPGEPFLAALDAEFGIVAPRVPGHDVVDGLRAMAAGQIEVFVGLGGNLVSAAPDSAIVEAAMERCALTVQVSTKLNRSHLHTGREALILPCLARSEADHTGGREQVVTVEDSMGVVHGSRGRLRPASSHLRSEVAVVAGLAAATLGDEPLGWSALAADYDRIRDRIAAVVPGFADFNDRLRAHGGFVLPQPARDGLRFPTASGKARLTVNPLRHTRVPGGRLLLQTIRSHDQFNTTVYGLDDRYRGVRGGRQVVFVHPADVVELGLADGDRVDVVGEWPDGVERRMADVRLIAYPTARGCAAAYFPEANVLVPLDSTADESNTPTSKSIIVRLEAGLAQGSAP